MEASDAILRFLDGVGRRSEAEFYLALFRAESKESFATLVVEAAVLRHAFEAVVLDLRFLHGLGLVPVVVLGVFSPGAAAVENAERLRRRMERNEVPCDVHRVGAAADAVIASARANRIPILVFDATGDEAATRLDIVGDLAATLRTRKLIFVARRGGLRPRGAERDLPIINLATDSDKLLQTHALPPKQMFLLAHARRLLVEKVSHRMLVAMTSPLQLLRELFTVRGAGTLVKRGSAIARTDGYAGVDTARLRALLESSFGRAPSEDFFDRPMTRVYLEENYRGAALVLETQLGGYLSKFAVEREAQGEGIGRDLWQLVIADYPAIFWRARPYNPIAPWYTQECDGMARFPEWHVFWRGMPTERIEECIEWALAQPADFG